MIQIDYIVEDSGWAIGKIGNGNEIIEFDISFFNDSLKELAEAAIEIKDKNKSVVFMSEPGKHKLVLVKGDGNKVYYELRWYSDWASWNLIDDNNFSVELKGETTVTNLINEIRNILIKIMEEIGPVAYKEKWIAHDFPFSKFDQIK